ncbi:MAG: hypothetical protein ACOCW2_00015 [Chitinivibrionales bacterium]
MTHKQFIHAYRQGLCVPRIEPAEALQFMFSGGVMSRLRFTFYIWSAIWLSLVGLTVYFFFIAAIINGLVITVFAYFLPYGMFRYAADYIITRSLDDESFYRLITGAKIMFVEQQPPALSDSIRAQDNHLSHQS